MKRARSIEKRTEIKNCNLMKVLTSIECFHTKVDGANETHGQRRYYDDVSPVRNRIIGIEYRLITSHTNMLLQQQQSQLPRFRTSVRRQNL